MENIFDSENSDTISSMRTLNTANHLNNFSAVVSTVCFNIATIKLYKAKTSF